eukprot:gene3110-5280_t
MENWLEYLLKPEQLDELINNLNQKTINEPTPSEIVTTFLEKSISHSTKPSSHRKEFLISTAEKVADKLHFSIQDIQEIPLKYQKNIILALIKISKEKQKDINYREILYHHWILKCHLKKISFDEIFIKEGENFEETAEEIIKKSVICLENGIKKSNYLPETFQLKEENEVEFDLGKYFFINENFEKAKYYLSKVNTKESRNMFNACESVLHKQKTEIEKMKTKILNNVSSKEFNLLPGLKSNSNEPILNQNLLNEFFNLLIKDNVQQNFTYQERFNLVHDFYLFQNVQIQILALNFIKLLFLHSKDNSFVPYFYQENFIKNFIKFSQKTFDLLKKNEMEEKFDFIKDNIIENILKMLNFKNDSNLWNYLKENGKSFLMNELDHSSNKKRKYEDISLDEPYELLNDELLNPKKFKIQDVSYLIKKSFDFLVKKEFKQSLKLLNFVKQSPVKSKQISIDIKYISLLNELNQLKNKENLKNLMKLIEEKEYCEIPILIEIFNFLINQNEISFIIQYFEKLKQENISVQINLISSFFVDFTKLNANDIDSWYKFLFKICKKENDDFVSKMNDEFFFILISNENYSEMIKFSSFLGYSLYSLLIFQKDSIENFTNFKNLASFTFNENSLIAPSPNLSWVSSDDINEGKKNLMFMLKETLLKLNNLVLVNSIKNLSKEQISILLFSLGDLFFFENDFKSCLKFYLKSINFLKIENLKQYDLILKRVYHCLNALNLYTAGAVVYQFLNLNYDQNLLMNLKSLDRIWLPYFYDLNYLEIFLYFESQKDLILKLMSRINSLKD